MSKRQFSTLEEKIEWLLKHPTFLVGKAENNRQKIVTAMKHDGLISRLTYWPDVNLNDAVHQAKIRWFALHNR
jgi:hypothetical protein